MKKLEKNIIFKDFDYVKTEINIKNDKLNTIISFFMEEEKNIFEDYIIEKNNKEFKDQQRVIQDDDEILNEQFINDENYTSKSEHHYIDDGQSNSDELPSDIKTIYRKIVMLIHPDKIKNNYNYEIYSDYYKKTIKSKKDNDISELLYIAYKLNIDDIYDIDDMYFNNMKIKINEIKNMSNLIDMNSFWVWYHTDNNKLKRLMVEQITKNNQCL